MPRYFLIFVCVSVLVLLVFGVRAVNGNDSIGNVERVVDGDTFVLAGGERVRIVGVDAPEISSDDCYAVEAKDALSGMILGKTVVLVDDADASDVYGRHLAYVMVDGVDVGLALAKDGFVRYMFVKPNYARADSIKASVYSAVDSKKGMWSDDGC